MLKYGGAWRSPLLRRRAGRRFRPRVLLGMRMARPAWPGPAGCAGPGAVPGGARAPPARRARLRRRGGSGRGGERGPGGGTAGLGWGGNLRLRGAWRGGTGPSLVSVTLEASSSLNKCCCDSAGSGSMEPVCSSGLFGIVSYKDSLDVRCPFSVNDEFDSSQKWQVLHAHM